MKKQRYILEDLPEGASGFLHKTLTGEWHGVWLDDHTLFVLADVDVHEMDAIAANSACQLFASTTDTTPANQQVNAFEKTKAQKQGKGAPAGVPAYFSAHGIIDTDTIGQAGLKIARKFKVKHLEP